MLFADVTKSTRHKHNQDESIRPDGLSLDKYKLPRAHRDNAAKHLDSLLPGLCDTGFLQSVPGAWQVLLALANAHNPLLDLIQRLEGEVQPTQNIGPGRYLKEEMQ